jgi:hypothetical protein
MGRMVSSVQQSRIKYVIFFHPEERFSQCRRWYFQAIETILEHYTDIFVDESEVS